MTPSSIPVPASAPGPAPGPAPGHVPEVVLSADGAELAALVQRLLAGPAGPSGRVLVALCGAPGAGKSRVADVVARLAGGVVVPMDGFHLADAELSRRGLLARKGAPETFDEWGYAALLARLRRHPEHAVMAPGFDRDLEQPLAGAVAVGPEVPVVVTEGNYLLLDQPGWRAARAELDAVWHVRCDDDVRLPRLVARHVESGKSREAARAWVERVDEPNARLVASCADRADLVLDVTGWGGEAPAGS